MEVRVAEKVMGGVTNPNLIKLKELSDKLSVYESGRDNNENIYKLIVNEIRDVIESEYNISDSDERIIAVQKRICDKIRAIINNFKI